MATTVFKVRLFGVVSITETVLLPLFATYARVPEGLTATTFGPAPTGIGVPMKVSGGVSRT